MTYKTATIGDIASVQTGPFGSQLHNKDYVLDGTPIVTVEHLGERKITRQNLPCVSEADKDRLSKYTLQYGDLVFSRVGSVDRCSWVSEDEDGWMFSGRCLRVRPNDPAEIYHKYLYYFFSLESTKDFVRNIAVGATMPSINTRLLSEVPITYPRIEEQRAIAETLGALDNKIENNTKINHHLEQIAQAKFEQLLIAECADEPLGLLSDIAEINPMRALNRGKEAVYVEMANLPTRGSFPIDWTLRQFTGGMKFTNDDTIMARITPCLENGKTAYINFLDEGEIAFGSTEYIVIAPKTGYCSEMFYFLARYPDFVSYSVRNMNGSSGRQRVSGETIGRYELHIPTQESVNKFAKLAAPIMDTIRQNAFECRNLAALRDTLLPRLMAGELSGADL